MQRLLCTSICFVVAGGFPMLGTAANADEPPRVQQDGPVPHAGPEVSRPVGGTWIVEFANGVTETYWFLQYDLVTVFETNGIARVKQTVKDNSVEIVFGEDRQAGPSVPLAAIPAPSSPGTRVERWTRVGLRYVVERWSPGSQFPNATPLRGIAECPERTPGAITGIMQLGGRVKFSDQRALLLVSFEGSRTLDDTYICNLERVKDLTALRLVGTEVTDAGLAALARGRRAHELWEGDGLKNLTHLEFTGKLSDTGLQYLGEMTQLRQLHLQRNGLVTDAGLNHLKGLTNLESLIVTGCKVTDAGLAHLKGMTKLEKLDLSDTDVSDAGLEHLNGLTKLKFLTLARTTVTAAGVKKLQQALPNCQIGYSTVPAVGPPDARFVVAYWRFEDGTPDTRATGPNSILDSSEHKLHGTAINAPVYRANIAAKAVPQADARNSLSLELNGANQRIFVPDDSLFQLTKNLTVEAWINIRSTTPSGSVADAQILFRGDDRPGLDPYFLAVQGNKLAFSVQNAANKSAAVIAPLPGPNQWIHVAGTLDDATGQMRLYINGASVAQLVTDIRPLGALDRTQNPGIGIGGLQPAHGQYFNGLIDEIRISSEALPPDRFLNANSTRGPNPGLPRN